MANLTDADKVLRNDTGKDIVTQLTAIKTAIENGGGGGGGASTVSQLTDVLLSATIPDGDVLVRDNNLTGGKLWKNKTITVELTQAEYDQLVEDDEVLPDVDYYITDAPSMQGSSKDLSYDGTTKSTYTKIEEVASDVDDLSTNKQDKLTTSTGTITASSNVTLIRPNAIKWGKVKTLSCVFQVTGSTSTLGTIPSGFEPTNTIDFSVNGDSGHGCRLQIVAGNNTMAIASAPTQNEYYAFTVTYI